MERPEAIDAGTIILTGLKSDIVLDSVRLVVDEHKDKRCYQIPLEYQVKNTSWRVLKIILGTMKLSNNWAGIVTNKGE